MVVHDGRFEFGVRRLEVGGFSLEERPRMGRVKRVRPVVRAGECLRCFAAPKGAAKVEGRGWS